MEIAHTTKQLRPVFDPTSTTNPVFRSTCWTADQNAHQCKLLSHSRPALLTPLVRVAPMGADLSRLLQYARYGVRSRQTPPFASFGGCDWLRTLRGRCAASFSASMRACSRSRSRTEMPRCRSFAAFAGAFTTSLARTMSVCTLLHAVHAGHLWSSILFPSSSHPLLLFHPLRDPLPLFFKLCFF